MKIARIDVFTYTLAYRGGDYALSKARVQDAFPALVVRVKTDDGAIGWGETAPLGRAYLPAFFEGELEALKVLAPHLLGLDPRAADVLQRTMSAQLVAGMGAKCAIDMACLDLAGRAAVAPISVLLGGAHVTSFPAWESVPLVEPDAAAVLAAAARAHGATMLQVKVGGELHADVARVGAIVEAFNGGVVIADANGAWSLDGAMRAVRALARFGVTIEQPCRTLEDSAEVMRRFDLPFIVDECVGGLSDLVRARAAGATGVNVKPSRLGGLTSARLLRDAAAELGMAVILDDCWGGALTSAALAHLAVSARPESLLAATLFSELSAPLIADAPGRQADGRGVAPQGAGLGVTVDESLLGSPVWSVG